jgi:HK97 family phage prohead protease
MDKLYLEANVKQKDGVIEGIASTAIVDRQNESVNVDGWDIKNFKKAPRLLWAHDHTEPAIGKVTKIAVEGEGKRRHLKFNAIFQDVTEKARAIKKLVEDGFINTFSVGFRPLEMEGNEIIKQELLEISVVNVPANPEAMLLAYKDLSNSGFSIKTIEKVLGDKQAFEVQTLIFPKDKWDSVAEVKSWASKHDYRTDKVDETSDSWRLRQASPADFTRLRTICINPGADSDMDACKVKAVGGPRKSYANLFIDMEKRVSKLENQVELAVKGLKHLNPQGSKREARVIRLTLTKVIARSADKLLEAKPDDLTASHAKIIKRSSEKLIRSTKEELNG